MQAKFERLFKPFAFQPGPVAVSTAALHVVMQRGCGVMVGGGY